MQLLKSQAAAYTRIQLFLLWSTIFLGYEVALLACERKGNVGEKAATEAAWQISYLFVPILAAFLSRILAPGYLKKLPGKITGEQRLVIFSVTFIVHAIIGYQLLFFVILRDFSSIDEPGSFYDATSSLTKTVLVLWTLCVVPVEFVLGQAESIKPAGPSKTSSSK